MFIIAYWILFVNSFLSKNNNFLLTYFCDDVAALCFGIAFFVWMWYNKEKDIKTI